MDKHLDSPRWSVKHVSAYALADVVNNAGSNIPEADARTLWPALEKALGGKTWDGKEKVLEAFVNLMLHSNLYKCDQSIASQMRKILLREIKRNNASYRSHSFKLAAKFVAAEEDTDVFEEVLDIVCPVIEELGTDSEAMDIDSSGRDTSSATLKDTTLTHAISLILRASPNQVKNLDDWQDRLSRCLGLVRQCYTPENRSLGILLAIYEGLGHIFQRMPAIVDKSPESLEITLMAYARIAFDVTDQVEQVRLKAAEAVVDLSKVIEGANRIKVEFVDEVKKRKGEDRSTAVQQMLLRALKTLE